MIDPSLLGSVGPIVAATGAGLLIRRGLGVLEDRAAARAASEQRARDARADRPAPRPRIRPAVPAGQGARR